MSPYYICTKSTGVVPISALDVEFTVLGLLSVTFIPDYDELDILPEEYDIDLQRQFKSFEELHQYVQPLSYWKQHHPEWLV